jgi:hypothetical protein
MARLQTVLLLVITASVLSAGALMSAQPDYIELGPSTSLSIEVPEQFTLVLQRTNGQQRHLVTVSHDGDTARVYEPGRPVVLFETGELEASSVLWQLPLPAEPSWRVESAKLYSRVLEPSEVDGLVPWTPTSS